MQLGKGRAVLAQSWSLQIFASAGGAATMPDRAQSLLTAPGGLLDSLKEALSGKQRVDLLKAIEGIPR